jgi:hypothetical protein
MMMQIGGADLSASQTVSLCTVQPKLLQVDVISMIDIPGNTASLLVFCFCLFSRMFAHPLVYRS